LVRLLCENAKCTNLKQKTSQNQDDKPIAVQTATQTGSIPAGSPCLGKTSSDRKKASPGPLDDYQYVTKYCKLVTECYELSTKMTALLSKLILRLNHNLLA